MVVALWGLRPQIYDLGLKITYNTEYMRLIPPNGPTYSGEPGTTPFQEWTMLTLGWMRSYEDPDQYRVDLAHTLLCGTAIYNWHHR